MKSILSRDNPGFKQLKKLSGAARERRKAGLALLEGVHLVEAAKAAGIPLRELAVAEGALRHPEVAALIADGSVAATTVMPDGLFSELSTLETPVGLLATIPLPELAVPAAPDFALLLEDIQDPGNLGTILRSAAAAGVQAVWFSDGCCDAWSPKVLRAGMGAHFRLAIVERADLPAVARDFHGQVLATCMDGDSLYQCDMRGPLALMVGNEGAGLSDDLIAAASRRITIPMPGGMESLNAAIAAAVFLFERVRQTTA